MTKYKNLQKGLRISKIFRIFALDFDSHHKYQRLRHYFMMQQTTLYQHFTAGLTSVGWI